VDKVVRPNWYQLVRDHEIHVGADADDDHRGLFGYYCICLWFATSMLCSIGMSQVPSNYAEIAYFVTAMLVNMTVYAWTVGQISALVMKQDDEVVAKRAQMEIVEAYLGTIRVSRALKEQISLFFHSQLQDASFTSVPPDQIYDMLPVTLQLEVSRHTNRDLVGQCKLLVQCSELFRDKLSAMLREKCLQAETSVFRISEASTELLFIKTGGIELYNTSDIHSADADEVDARGVGSTVGAMAFMFGLRHFKNASTIAGTETIVFSLHLDAYRELMKAFPNEETLLMDAAMDKYERGGGDDDGKSMRSGKSKKSKISEGHGSKLEVFAIDGGGEEDISKEKSTEDDLVAVVADARANGKACRLLAYAKHVLQGMKARWIN